MACGIADFFELKPLNCVDNWSTDTAESYARGKISQHLTQLHWKKRPKDDVLKPILKTEVPDTIEEGVDYRELIGSVLNDISLYEARRKQNALPDVLCYNEPVFSYEQGDNNSSYQRVSLSPVFLFALSSSIKAGFPELSRRSSLFQPPTTRPTLDWGAQSTVRDILEKALITTPVEKLKKEARSLGRRFPGDPAPTPTPPNPAAEERFQGTVKGVKKLPKPHIKTLPGEDKPVGT